MTTTVFFAVPSYAGISDEEARERCAAKALEEAGHVTGVAVLKHVALIDLVRAELTTLFMSKTKCGLVLYQDDDISIAGKSILRMIDIMASRPDVGVISAPCKMRQEGHIYNISPTSAPDTDRLVECFWTGLGSVLVKREVLKTLYARNPRLWFKSQMVPGASSVGLFNSVIGDAAEYEPSAPEGVGIYLGDDRAFSHRLCQAGITIHAYVDAETDHRGLKGNLGADMKLADEEARRQGQAPVEPVGLVGPNGRPL